MAAAELRVQISHGGGKLEEMLSSHLLPTTQFAVISSSNENFIPTEDRNELNLEQTLRHNIIAICELILDMFRELCFLGGDSEESERFYSMRTQFPDLFYYFAFSVHFSVKAKTAENCFIQLHSSAPEENKESQPLSKTRISTSHEDISRDDMLGDGDFRRVKSERRTKSYFRRNYKLPSKEEEKFERQRSLRLRQSIRAKWGLPDPSRKNPLLSDS